MLPLAGDFVSRTTNNTTTQQPRELMAHILPNDIIMRIIREADGGRHTNKLKMDNVLSHLNKVIGQANCQYTSEVYGSLYVCFQDDCWWGDARYTMWVKTPEWLEELGDDGLMDVDDLTDEE